MNFVIGAGVLIFAIFLIVLGVSVVIVAITEIIDDMILAKEAQRNFERRKAQEEQEQEEPFFKDGRQN